jgi:hypothetical protein
VCVSIAPVKAVLRVGMLCKLCDVMAIWKRGLVSLAFYASCILCSCFILTVSYILSALVGHSDDYCIIYLYYFSSYLSFSSSSSSSYYYYYFISLLVIYLF